MVIKSLRILSIEKREFSPSYFIDQKCQWGRLLGRNARPGGLNQGRKVWEKENRGKRGWGSESLILMWCQSVSDKLDKGKLKQQNCAGVCVGKESSELRNLESVGGRGRELHPGRGLKDQPSLKVFIYYVYLQSAKKNEPRFLAVGRGACLSSSRSPSFNSWVYQSLKSLKGWCVFPPRKISFIFWEIREGEGEGRKPSPNL